MLDVELENLMVLSGYLNGQMAQLNAYYWNQNPFFYDANGVRFAQMYTSTR